MIGKYSFIVTQVQVRYTLYTWYFSYMSYDECIEYNEARFAEEEVFLLFII